MNTLGIEPITLSPPPPSLSTRLASMLADKRRVQGLSFILLVAIIWVAASFLVKEIVSEGLAPLVLTYIANSLFAICLPVYWARTMWLARYSGDNPGARHKGGGYSALINTNDDTPAAAATIPATTTPAADTSGRGVGDEDEDAMYYDGIDDDLLPLQAPEPVVYGHAKTFRAALVVAPLWFAAQLTFNLSLSATSVTSNTILSSTSSLFTFGLSVLLLGEVFTVTKLMSILACMAGTAMVTVGDSRAPAPDGGTLTTPNTMTSSVSGDLLALLSASLYASYTLAIRMQLPDDDKVSMLLFFGYVGIINLVAVSPVIIIAQLLRVINLGALTWHAIGLTIIKGLFDNVLSDYLWARAVLLIGPTLATVGLSIQVPMTVAVEMLFTHPAYLQHAGSAVLVLLGGACVLVGFFGINLS